MLPVEENVEISDCQTKQTVGFAVRIYAAENILWKTRDPRKEKYF